MTTTVLTKDSDADPPEESGDATGDERAGGRASVLVTRVRDWFSSDTRVARLVELLALLPVISMIIEVTRAGKLQWLDYWYVIIRVFNDDGSYFPARIFQPQNEHPLAIPSLLYTLDAKLFDGDNRVLGMLVIAVAAATVLLLRAALPKSLPPLVRASIVVAASALIFSLHGIHLFVRSMSGSAWLTANLIVIASLLLAYRGKWRWAWGVGIVASMTYGTAFALWPALALLAWINREKLWVRWTPIGIGAVVIVIWQILKPATWIGSTPANDLGSLMFTFLSVIGHLWTADNAGFSVMAGVVIIVLYLVLLGNPTARHRSMRFWWSFAVYAILACGMIAVARIDFGSEVGLSSRYSSLAAPVAIPLLVLLGVVVHKGIRRNAQKIAVVLIGVGVAGYALGLPTAIGIRRDIQGHGLAAIAIRAGFGDTLGPVLPAEKYLEPKLRSLGHYPFNDSFTLGCGGPELGSKIDMAKAKPLHNDPGTRAPAYSMGEVESIDDRGEASFITGWVTGGVSRNATPVKCTLVVDGNGKVTGAGISKLPRPELNRKYWDLPADVGFEALGPVDEDTKILVIFEGGAMRWLPAKAPDEGEQK